MDKNRHWAPELTFKPTNSLIQMHICALALTVFAVWLFVYLVFIRSSSSPSSSFSVEQIMHIAQRTHSSWPMCVYVFHLRAYKAHHSFPSGAVIVGNQNTKILARATGERQSASQGWMIAPKQKWQSKYTLKQMGSRTANRKAKISTERSSQQQQQQQPHLCYVFLFWLFPNSATRYSNTEWERFHQFSGMRAQILIWNSPLKLSSKFFDNAFSCNFPPSLRYSFVCSFARSHSFFAWCVFRLYSLLFDIIHFVNLERSQRVTNS